MLAVTAVHAFGTVVNSPGRNVVTSGLGAAAGLLPPLTRNQTPTPMSAATASTPPQR